MFKELNSQKCDSGRGSSPDLLGERELTTPLDLLAELRGEGMGEQKRVEENGEDEEGEGLGIPSFAHLLPLSQPKWEKVGRDKGREGKRGRKGGGEGTGVRPSSLSSWIRQWLAAGDTGKRKQVDTAGKWIAWRKDSHKHESDLRRTRGRVFPFKLSGRGGKGHRRFSNCAIYYYTSK